MNAKSQSFFEKNAGIFFADKVSLPKSTRLFQGRLRGFPGRSYIPFDSYKKKYISLIFLLTTVAKSFTQQLVRLTSLSHLAQAARTVMTNMDAVAQMTMDFLDIPVNDIIKQISWINSSPSNNSNERLIYKCMSLICF